ncbi:hypothetical protein RND71_012214 [Anisodus tanguticus]|uniref:Cupin type-1 domain-containing protein n=1 Tax=Anisodus tanguticus TaxID=243964 RepID=A0AAE1VGR6_9SOLA|nr:hypothetical protein RND71_012214 [Anisodus tanguticus]
MCTQFLLGQLFIWRIELKATDFTLFAALILPQKPWDVMLSRQPSGPIVHLSGSHHTNIWSKFLDLEPHQGLAHLKRIDNVEEEASPKEEESTWSLRKFLFTLLNREDVIERVNHKAPSTYNLYNRKPDFKNDYGWSKKLDESDYSPLELSGNGVYLVNLSPMFYLCFLVNIGILMAPHVNPTAIEYGIGLKGTGRIQIVYPNGTLAMNAKVRERGRFLVPRKNDQQFLVGKNSWMQSLRGPEFAAAFGIGEKRLKRIANAQREQVILPSSSSDSPLKMKMGFY